MHTKLCQIPTFWRLLVPTVISVSLLACLMGADDGTTTFNGAWQVAAVSMNGKDLSKDQVQASGLEVLIEEGTMTVKSRVPGAAEISIDKDNKHLKGTWTEGPQKGTKFEGLIRLNKNTLELCLDMKGKGRPDSFDTAKDDGRSLWKLERAQSKKRRRPKTDLNSLKLIGRSRLRQVYLGFMQYIDKHGHLPAHAIYSDAGKPLLSWRVAILPYLGLENAKLYQQFRLNEPWDSKHNKKLLSQMPTIYSAFDDSRNEKNAAYFHVFVGKGTCFDGKKGMTPADIEDAPGKTILVVQGHKPVPWTKPEDISYSATESIPDLGCSYNQSFPVLFADGAVRFVNKDFDDKVFRQAILRSDNLPGDLNDLVGPVRLLDDGKD